MAIISFPFNGFTPSFVGDTLRLLLSQVPATAWHLRKGGRLVLVLSSLSNTVALKEAVDRLGLKISKKFKKHYFFEDILVWLLAV